MDWSDYEVFDAGVDRPLGELSRSEARAAFDRLMQVRHDRVGQLQMLVAANGVDLGATDAVQHLNDWFATSVQPNPVTPGRLDSIWYSVVNDIGLFLGEQAIAESDGKLRWEFWTAGKRDVSYQRHVIVGFDVANQRYNVDFDLIVGMYGHRLIRETEEEPEFFVGLLQGAADKV